MVEQFEAVNNEIHDQWFSVDDIEYDEGASIWRVWFGPRSLIRRGSTTLKGVPESKVLEILGVQSFEIVDTEQVLWYDFNELEYNPRDERLSILTNIPLTLRLVVSEPRVRVVEGSEGFD